MKSLSVNQLEVLSQTEVKVSKTSEEVVPPWRKRMRWWLSKLLTPSSLVRLVGPNERPLERHEFESKQKYETLRNRVL